MTASPPSRSTYSFVVHAGLVPLALDMYSGQEDSRSAIKRSQFVQEKGELHPVGMTSYDKVDGVNVNKADIIKCVEADDGSLVEITDEEVQQLVTAENGDAELLGFIKRGVFLENYVTEKLYQVRPQRKLPGQKKAPAVSPYAKPFALFMRAMERKHMVALLKLTVRGTTRFFSLFPDGRMYSLLFDEEIREARPMPEVEVNPKELTMAENLLDALALQDVPAFEDETASKVYAFVQQKAAAQAKGETVALPEVKEQDTADVSDDLSALLAASMP